MTRISNQADQRHHVLGRPIARHQGFARFSGRWRGADKADHFIDIGDRNGKTHQHVSAIARLAEQVLGAAADNLLAEGREGLDHVLQVELLGAPAIDRQHVGAKRGLQVGVAPQLVQHHFGHRIALQLDDDPHALAVALVPDVGDAFHPLVAHEVGDLLDQHPLVDLIGDRGHDQRLAILADLLDLDARTHHDRTAAFVVGGMDAGPAKDHATGWKVGAGHDLDQVVDAKFGIIELGKAGVDDFAKVMRRNVGRHANGDAARAIDEQVGKLCRQRHGLSLGAIVVLLKINRLLVEIIKQRF